MGRVMLFSVAVLIVVSIIWLVDRESCRPQSGNYYTGQIIAIQTGRDSTFAEDPEGLGLRGFKFKDRYDIATVEFKQQGRLGTYVFTYKIAIENQDNLLQIGLSVRRYLSDHGVWIPG